MILKLTRPTLIVLCLLQPIGIPAQATAETEVPPVAASAPLATDAPVVAPPASAVPATPPAESAAAIEPPPAPAPEGCRPLTFKAMAADVKAFNAQAQKFDLTEQARLFDEALSLWSQALTQCDGRAREQAQHNLENSQKARANISEQLGSGAQCATVHKDAETLQNMAKQALGERRWTDASILFHKSENMWDMAVEYCTGRQQEIAVRRRGESAIDGHNAEFCAPLFESAREQTQKLRSSTVILSSEDKQNLSMVAETLWRDAMTQCKGATVQDIARNNAQSLARERGTPWVARSLPGAQPVSQVAQESRPPADAAAPAPPASPAPTVGAGDRKPPAEAPSVVATAAPIAGEVAGAATLARSPAPAPAIQVAAPAPAQEPKKAKVEVFKAEDAKGLGNYTGPGKVLWASGEVYEGDLLKGQRHGKGTFVWLNGQSYSGDWEADKPMGQGRMKFANGNLYEGGMANAIPQGRGRMQYASGDLYTGNFNAGLPDGVGMYVWKNGQKYEGDWLNGSPNGQGRLLFVSGETYTGKVRNGEPDGQGEYVFANGDKYTGQWQVGKRSGAGRMQLSSGESYVGNYVNGEPEGQGEYNFVNGDKYVGQWKAGKKHGQGTYYWKDGSRWDGMFESDERTGQNQPIPSN